MFSREQARQRALYPRTEKIEVTLQGQGLQGTLLVMNKGMSTPHSCARRKFNKQSCVCVRTEGIGLQISVSVSEQDND